MMSKKALGRGLSALFSPASSSAVESDMLELGIEEIEPNRAQPRHIFKAEKLEELAQSIRVNGLIQPIVVRRHDDSFQIIAGERRWRAAQLAGLTKVPCLIKDVRDDEMLALSLIENIQREELNPIEEATAYKNLIEQLNATQEEIARQVGKDRASIANSIRLLKLPMEIQHMVEEELLTMGHARALLALDSEEKQMAMAKQVIVQSLSVRETEKLIKRIQEGEIEKPQPQPDPIIERERANIQQAETRLSRKLSAPVKIKFSEKGGQIEIGFASMDDLMRVYDLLEAQIKADADY